MRGELKIRGCKRDLAPVTEQIGRNERVGGRGGDRDASRWTGERAPGYRVAAKNSQASQAA